MITEGDGRKSIVLVCKFHQNGVTMQTEYVSIYLSTPSYRKRDSPRKFSHNKTEEVLLFCQCISFCKQQLSL